MNIIQWVLSKFGREYVYLVHHDGDRNCKPAFKYPLGWYSAPYLPETAVRLLAGGKTHGKIYIHGWEPITEGLIYLYDQESDNG